MSEYLMDSGHNDMRTCDGCGGAFYASRGPSGEEEDWTCDTCTEKDATIQALVADNAALVKKMRAAGDALHRGGYVDLTTGGDQPGAVLLERLKRLSGLLELVAASDTDAHGNPFVSKRLIPEIREALKDL